MDKLISFDSFEARTGIHLTLYKGLCHGDEIGGDFVPMNDFEAELLCRARFYCGCEPSVRDRIKVVNIAENSGLRLGSNFVYEELARKFESDREVIVLPKTFFGDASGPTGLTTDVYRVDVRNLVRNDSVLNALMHHYPFVRN